MIAALFGLGAAFFGLHALPGARKILAEWVLENESLFLTLGWLISGIGLLLTLCFYALQRGSYLRLEMGGKEFSVDAPLVEARINHFLQEEFPELHTAAEVYFSGQKIEVVTHQKFEDLEEVERRLAKMLASEFGYKKPFYVTLH